MAENQQTVRINPGYPLFQLAKALTTSTDHVNAETRERAQSKVKKWTCVFTDIINGKLDVGSRKPLENAPTWVTLEVITGGFATGELLAGGKLLDHEQSLLEKLSIPADSKARQALNSYFITDTGLSLLQEQLNSGCYDISIPEEGALLVVAWLLQNGHAQDARDILDEIGPYFSRLRFYPVPLDIPRRFGSRVFLQDVEKTIEDLKKINPNCRILAQKEAVHVWTPLYDRAISLFLETVEGDIPNLQIDSNGKQLRTNGKFSIKGGWPCKKYPDGWQFRAQSILDEFNNQRSQHKLCKKPQRAKENFAQLLEYIKKCVLDPSLLNGRDVGRIRLILARCITKRGIPNSPIWAKVRENQKQQVKGATFFELVAVVIARLHAHQQKAGIDNLDAFLRTISLEEANQWKIDIDTAIPPSAHKKVQRCLSDTIDVLVKTGIITSGDTLARVLPQMTAGLRATGITDPTLRNLYSAIYRAFRCRRSLLLLNLQSQVRLEELPWISKLEQFRTADLSTHELSKQALQEIVSVTITSFPYAILPNKLLQELRALVKGANLDLPLVDELATDIFMGTFSSKFLESARVAASILKGTLYEKYYGIDYTYILGLEIHEKKPSEGWFKNLFKQTTTITSPATNPFAGICAQRAGVRLGAWDSAINGMIIEQQQILTSQNLAVLFKGLNLQIMLTSSLMNMSKACFKWICQQQQIKVTKDHANLIMLKNSAYAWRQMIFFLSLLPQSQIDDFVGWMTTHMKSQRSDFQDRFSPVIKGLVLAAAGQTLCDFSWSQVGARRFLGWSKERHWLLHRDGSPTA